MKNGERRARNVSRRSFLKRAGASAAAIGAPWVVPASVLGAQSPANRVNVGMIGIGRQARYANMKSFLGAPDAQVVAVCEVDRWRLENARKQVEDHYGKNKRSGNYTGCATCTDFREVLDRPDVDAVMISTPDHWHVPMAIAAARAGKDICLEKPITMSIDEGRALCDAVERYGRVFRVDSEFRSIRVFHRTCELVLNGRIGEVQRIEVGVPKGDVGCDPQPEMPVPEELEYDMWLGPAPEAPYTERRVHPRHGYSRPGWMRVRDYCDGMVTNWGAHLVDIAQWGNGSELTGPVEVQARGKYPSDGLWNVLLNFEAEYRFADGVRMRYTTGRPFVRFEGTEGWIEAGYSGRTLEAQPESLLNEQIKPGEIHLPLKPEKRDFLDCVKTRETTLESAEVEHRTTSVCHLADISIRLGGRKLRWDPDAERFLNSDAANRLTRRRALRPLWGLYLRV